MTKKAAWFKGTLMAGAAAAALFSMSANAVLITSWTFANASGLSNPTWLLALPGTISGVSTIPGDATKWQWGTPIGVNQSSLVVGPDVAGVIVTNGLAADGVQLTHNNFPIFVPTQLTGGTLDDQLVLTPLTPLGAALPPFLVSFTFLFTETENNPVSGTCVDGTLLSDAANSPDGCQDIFAITNPSGLAGSFVLDGFLYTVAIDVAGLGPLSNGACTAVGLAPGCAGFETKENFSNVLNPEFTITAQPVSVPEPGTLALVGLALAGIGFAGRRRAS